MKIKTGIAIVWVALLVAACSTATPAAAVATETNSEAAMPTATEAAAMTEATAADGSMEVTVSFSQDVWPIIEENALAAHGGKGGVFLESYDDIMNYVVPGDPENSMLYRVLIGDGVPRMPPPPEAALADEMIQTIYDWIDQGALNN